MLGQVSIKPTTLPCVCAPQVETPINSEPNRCRCNHPAGHHKANELLGRNADGTWKTAQANAYSPEMCRHLARTLHQSAESRWSNDQPPDAWPLPEEYVELFIPLDPYYDFQGAPTACTTATGRSRLKVRSAVRHTEFQGTVRCTQTSQANPTSNGHG